MVLYGSVFDLAGGEFLTDGQGVVPLLDVAGEFVGGGGAADGVVGFHGVGEKVFAQRFGFLYVVEADELVVGCGEIGVFLRFAGVADAIKDEGKSDAVGLHF